MTRAPETPGLNWRKSSRSAGNGNCVEVAVLRDLIAVRDSKDPDGPILTFGTNSWQDFLGAIRSGAYDLPAE